MAMEDRQPASRCTDISNADEKMKCIAEISALSKYDQMFCPVNIAEVVDHLYNVNPAKDAPFIQNVTKLLCEDDMKFYLVEWKEDLRRNKWGHVKVYQNNEFLIEGWIRDIALSATDRKEEARILREEEVNERRRIQADWEESERERENAERDKKIAEDKDRRTRELLIKKQPQNMQKLIRAGKVVLGMTKDVVILSWGKPDDIHRTISPGNVHEQWVYRGSYLYFENGVLTSFQD
jgi:hypothetical protein